MRIAHVTLNFISTCFANTIIPFISSSTRESFKNFIIHLSHNNVEEASYRLRSPLCTPEIVAKQDIVCVQVDDGRNAPAK
jgi:hypothetical protein